MFWTFLFLIFGFFLLIRSADFLVNASAGIAKRFHVPKMVMGLTLVAFGTSAPEGTVSVIAALQNNPDISIGNIVGSNIANIALILGLAAALRAIPVKRSTITVAVPLCILSSLVFLVLGYDVVFQNHSVGFDRFSLGDGLIFLFFFVVFLYYIYADFKVAQQKEEEMEKKERAHFKDTWWYLAMTLIGGIAGILVGGKLVVDNAVLVAQFFHVSQAVIGVTVVAIGTSLPELATSIVATYKKESDIAVGNIIGSNIFNIFLVLGLTAVIHPVNFDPRMVLDSLVMLLVTVVLFVIVLTQKSIPRWGGMLLIFLYFLYLISLGFREVVMAYLPM